MILKQSSLNVETGIKITESEQWIALSFVMNGWYIYTSYEKFHILYKGGLKWYTQKTNILHENCIKIKGQKKWIYIMVFT